MNSNSMRARTALSGKRSFTGNVGSALRRGFTLIEVLVSLAIVAIGMAAVMGAVNSSGNMVGYLKDKTLAQWVALNIIANLRLQITPGQTPSPTGQVQLPPTETTNGDMDYAGRKWHWRQEVSNTQVKGIVRVDVKVRPEEIKAGDDNGWFVTLSGIIGNAVSKPTGTSPTWGSGNIFPNGPGQQPPGNVLGGAATPNPGGTTPNQNGGTTPTPTPPTPQTGATNQ